MPKAADYPDVFMQFRTIEHAHHANLHTTLTESYVETGLEIRGGLGWLVHMVEWEWAASPILGTNRVVFAVSTRRAQATMPNYGARGCLARGGMVSGGNGGAGSLSLALATERIPFRPPVVIASRYVATYVQMDADVAALDGKTSRLRIGYTTLKLTPADYIEIAETWGE